MAYPLPANFKLENLYFVCQRIEHNPAVLNESRRAAQNYVSGVAPGTPIDREDRGEVKGKFDPGGFLNFTWQQKFAYSSPQGPQEIMVTLDTDTVMQLVNAEELFYFEDNAEDKGEE